MVHVFTLGNFSGELRRKDCLCGTGHFFLDFADLAQQVGPLLSRGIGSLAALSVEDAKGRRVKPLTGAVP